MMLFLAITGIGLLFAGAWWIDKQREAEMLARLEKLREHPGAAAAFVDKKIAERKRETEMLGRLRDHGGR